jgi:hypothetical protein
MKTETIPSPESVKSQLDRIPQSERFRGSAKQKEFLRFVVGETLANRASQPLEHAVGIDPEYGLAWAMLGHLHADNHALGFFRVLR